MTAPIVERPNPGNREILDRIVAVEGKVGRIAAIEEKVERMLYAFSIDDPTDKSQWRRLEKEYGIVKVQRTFCEKIGWRVIWIVVAIAGAIGVSNLEHLKRLVGIR